MATATTTITATATSTDREPPCYGRAVRLRAVLIVALLASRRAAADDIRGEFGFAKKPSDAPVRCADTHVLGCVWAEDDLDAETPYALATWLPASYLMTLPVGDATHDQLAGYALGGTRDETGPVFGSGNGLENRWTLDGSPIDNAQFGGADTKIPLAFLSGMLVTAGGFSARDRTSLGGTIDAQLVKGGAQNELDVRFYGSLTGGAAHRPDALATYQLRNLVGETGPEVSASAVAKGPIAPGIWYAAGVAYQRAYSDITATAARLVDANGDGLADLDSQGRFVLDPIANTTTRYATNTVNAMARAGWDSGHHHVDATLLGSYTGNTQLLALATDAASGIDRATYIGDAIATYHGDWDDTHVKLQAGWHRSMLRESAHDAAAASTPQTLSAYVPDGTSLSAACTDDPNSMFVHCPIPLGFFASGGAGLLTDTTADRPSISADITHRIGDHVLRAGATGEDTRLVLDSRFTGGDEIRSLFPGHTDELRFYSGACGPQPTDPCNYETSQELAYRTRYTAAYVEDTFTPAKGLRVDGGMRWELMWVGSRLQFSDELSPRLGITWSLFDGHAKAWASMGRSFALLPAGLGQTIIAQNATVADSTVANLGTARTIDPGTPLAVAAGVQPVAQDEVTTGITAGIAKVVQLTAWISGRWLERGLDTTPTGLDNPGTNGDDPATRNSAIFAIQLQTAGNPSIRAGYQYGRAWGTWTGAYDPRQGAVLYAGDDYDSGSVNLNGRLPADQGHRVFVEGERHGSVAGLPVSAALRLTLGSGRPRDVVADTDTGDYQLLPRGSNGRGPMLSQANVRVATRWRGIDFTLDVFNLFDRRDPTNLDQVYTKDSVMPISGGEASDLIWLRNANGDPATRSRTYGLPTAFQSPVSVTLGARRTF